MMKQMSLKSRRELLASIKGKYADANWTEKGKILDGFVAATGYDRKYQQAYVEDINLKFIISAIQERFADRGFPLEDMEYALKQLQTERALDNTENFSTDARAQLLNTARPDIYLDLDYEFRDFGLYNKLVFIINAVDAYSNKTIGAAQNPGIETTSNDIVQAMTEQVELNITNLQGLMQSHFDDINTNGREITLRVKILDDAVFDLRREKCGSRLPYTMWIQKWVKSNAVNGSNRRQLATATELKFNQVRIPLYDESGFPQGASEWAFKLSEALFDDCNVIAIDNTQSLGDAFIILSQ